MEDDARVEEMTDAELETAEVEETQEAVEEETQPVTVESLQEQLAEERRLREESETKLGRQLKSNQDKEQFIQRQGNEIGELRKIKEALLARKKAIQEQDASEQMISDPQGFRNASAELAQIDREVGDVETQERQLQGQIMQEQARRSLVGTPDTPGPAHDLEDNMETIVSILKDGGDDDQMIQQFRQNPFVFAPGIVRSLNAQAKLVKENETLKAEIEKLKGNTGKVLKKIETTARKPVANLAGASETEIDLSDLDIANLSDKELNRLLKEAG